MNTCAELDDRCAAWRDLCKVNRRSESAPCLDLSLEPTDLRDPLALPAPTFFGAYAQWAATPPPSWDDVAWLAQLWGGPFLVKGITRVDDARRAVDAGATAVSVSNHGGNDMDGTPATIRALPAVAAAVGGQVEVLLDGGIRRGGDVVKAARCGPVAAGPGLGQPRRADGASRPRARARATASPRRCVPSLA
jgi:isopentenyl diphosphate isomerase/L-lactate dehydrogenase-like FMN-dependent dehydrogenase